MIFLNQRAKRPIIINAMLFRKGKIAFQVLLIILLQWSPTNCQWNLYDTDQRFQSDSLQYDCLDYRSRHETLTYQYLSDVVDEMIPYCFRPSIDDNKSLEIFDDPLPRKLWFEELSKADVTVQQLFSWSAPMEVAERYQSYLNTLNSTLNDYFYNCTPPWFGLRCEYSFEFDGKFSFNEIVEADFHGRIGYFESSGMQVEVPCYVLLQCHRNSQSWCLDWREICDGNIDCFDNGTDEQFCFDMELNECSDEEYRCHNGLCISQEFWDNGLGDTDCLDRSDRAIETPYVQSCFRDPTFRCEEHSCRPTLNSFSCGDGECVVTFKDCQNGRHVLMTNFITAKGNLKDECWKAMICLTRLLKEVNDTLCEIWLLDNSTVYETLEQCDRFFQFPTVPIYSDHVRFLYEEPHLKLNEDLLLSPDYICYDKKLCDFHSEDFIHENRSCLDATDFQLRKNGSKNPWVSIMLTIGEYFRPCLIPHFNVHDKTKHSKYTSLYNCKNSSKFISKHRILDRMIDCPDEDDEKYKNSCQLNDRYRLDCDKPAKCWSPLVKNAVCINQFNALREIRFQSFCDGINVSFSHDDYDESGCGNWLCNNMYARCDGIVACPDGRDEYNCSRTKCGSETYACISPINYTVICLHPDRISDTIPDCLGALDEKTKCHTISASANTVSLFQCSNKNQCLKASDVCNMQNDCSDRDDEHESLCKNQKFKCIEDSTHNRSEIEDVFCKLIEVENHQDKYFSIRTIHNYPPSENNVIGELDQPLIEQHPIKNDSLSQVWNNTWPWYCHRGLVIYNRTEKNNNSNNRTCICPPSYYGHFCQYQNQRVSLTLRLTSNDRYATYTIVSMLMDDTDERQQIHAYYQYQYIAKASCSMKLNRYLLFSSRPKNISHNYSVRIDIFEKNKMIYVGSWHFPIPFIFLPVNRLSVALNLSNHLLQHSFDSCNNCSNGECVKYVNKPNYFCRCSPGWSGIQCNISINCQKCSNGSICIGSSNNKSICVCPMNQYGRECSFISVCPINACQNGGQCVAADLSFPEGNYTCICTDRYFGHNCEYQNAKLDVLLDGISTPSHLVAHFFTLSINPDPIETILLRKLTLFQRIVTFHTSVSFQLTFIKAHNKYYLAVLQQSPKAEISTSISPQQECISVQYLLNATVLKMTPYKRIIHFHWLCQINYDLICFIDEAYLCLCTNDHHANCMRFNSQRDFICPSNNYCENDGQCLQDHPTCPSTKICLCPSCFFGTQCQFYAKGLGSTLDEILGYEFINNKRLSEQPMTVVIAASITIVLFIIGIINSILSIITFARENSRGMGCGIYLLGSSVTSLLTMIVFLMKFWFLFYSHQDRPDKMKILNGNCFGIELILKVLLYADNWLNACVAFERIVYVIKGTSFNKPLSIKIAIGISLSLMPIILCLFVPQIIYLRVFHDDEEERSWCVVKYSGWLATYSTILMFVHYFVPLIINILSIICITTITTYRRTLTQRNRSFCSHLRIQIRKNKHRLISSGLVVCLTLPYLIISIVLDCRKSSNLFWFYLIGYYLSFCPAAFIFLIFVLPSSHYRGEFYAFLKYISRRFEILKINSTKL